MEDMVNKSIVSGLPPAVSDVHIINGHPGPVHGCATNGTQMDKNTKNHQKIITLEHDMNWGDGFGVLNSTK